MASAWDEVRALVRDEGALRTLGHVAGFAKERAEDAWEDRQLGIRTGRRLSPAALGLTTPYAEKYAPSDYRTLRRVLDQAVPDPRGEVLLDYGAGMGRVLVVAGLRPFARIEGIELSDRLVDDARRNLDRVRGRLACPDVSVRVADATTYAVPHDVTVAYLYSPFTGPVLAGALARCAESWAARPRRLRLVAKDPEAFEAAVAAHPAFRRVDELSAQGEHARRRCVIYEAPAP